jgi:hypothetical protein
MKSQIDCLKSAPFPIDYRLKIDHRDNTTSDTYKFEVKATKIHKGIPALPFIYACNNARNKKNY